MRAIVLPYNGGMGPVDRLLADLRAIFASRLTSLVVYGSHAGGAAPASVPMHTLALVDEVGVADLEGCARAAARWQADGIAVPLVISRREFARSLDVFPLEFGAILAAHRVVFGDDPFRGLSVNEQDVRRACEVDVKGHLLHLREAFIESHGDPGQIGRLVEASSAALRTLCANVARLDGQAATPPAALAAYLSTRLGPVHGRTLETVLGLGDAPMPAGDAARVFPAYLAAAEALATYVDAWK
jgi:hypothetical protein